MSLAVHVWRRGTARPKGRRFGLVVPRSSTRDGAVGSEIFTSHLILLFLAKSGAHRTTTDLDWTPWCEDATTLHALLFLDLIEEEAATLLAPSCRKSHSGARTDVTSPHEGKLARWQDEAMMSGGWAINRTPPAQTDLQFSFFAIVGHSLI